MDVFSAALFPGKALDLEEQRVRELRRDDVEDGAPPGGSTSTAGSTTSTQVVLQPVGQLDRPAQGDEVAAGDHVGGDPQPVGGDPPLESAGKSRSSRPATTRVGTSGHAGQRPRVLERPGRTGRTAAAAAAASDVGRDVVEVHHRVVVGVAGRCPPAPVRGPGLALAGDRPPVAPVSPG